MTDEASISIKRGHTTRIPESLANETGGTPVDLTGKEIRVVLVKDALTVPLASGSGLGLTSAPAGTWWWDVTAANLTALGEPNDFDVFLTIWNADNSILVSDAFTVNVSW